MEWRQFSTKDRGDLSPFFMPMMLANMASGIVAIVTGARGPNFAPVSACATSGHAIGEAAEIIRRGSADVMLAGGSEAPVARVVVAGFNAMDALSTRNDDPPRASRPFDAERDGFVLGEGGAVLVLESERHAQRRGARVLATIGWLRSNERCQPHRSAGTEWAADGASHVFGAGERGAGAEPDRLHQRSRNFDPTE